MRRRMAILVLLAAAALAACGSPTAQPADAPADEPAAGTPAAPTQAAAAETGADDETGAQLSAECEAAIRDLLVAIEPVAEGIDWSGEISDADLEAMIAVTEQEPDAFDRDVCPDVGIEEAHAAWTRIAEESAPGAREYIDYVYSQ